MPKSLKEALRLDEENGNNLWKEAIQKEVDQIREYETFKPWKEKTPPKGYQFIRLHFVFDVKHDLRRKTRLVAGGHMTTASNEDAYSSVVSLRGMRACIFIAELNNLKIMVGDIGNAYLEAFTTLQD